MTTDPDVLVLEPGRAGLVRATVGRKLPVAFAEGARVLASARGGRLRCSPWAMTPPERARLARRLRALAWLVENGAPDEAESRECGPC